MLPEEKTHIQFDVKLLFFLTHTCFLRRLSIQLILNYATNMSMMYVSSIEISLDWIKIMMIRLMIY